jgi:hypothetical protein
MVDSPGFLRVNGERRRKRLLRNKNLRPVSDTHGSPSFRARPQAATRNPGRGNWIPACAGMTDRDALLVSAPVLSAPHYGRLRMTIPLRFRVTERLSGNRQTTLQLTKPCFDRLSTNGKNPTNAMPDPFALSLSKGERRTNRPLSSDFRRASER